MICSHLIPRRQKNNTPYQGINPTQFMTLREPWNLLIYTKYKQICSLWGHKSLTASTVGCTWAMPRNALWGVPQEPQSSWLLRGIATNTKARIFPRRLSTFHTFWCKIGSKMNLLSLYRRLLVAVSTMVIFSVAISMPSSFNVAVSTELCRYSNDNVKLT